MPWVDELVAKLAGQRTWGYHVEQPTATEPAALAALALLAHDHAAAQGPLDWLVRSQARDGTLGVIEGQASPHWPTALAVLAWSLADRQQSRPRYAGAIGRAIAALLAIAGKAVPRESFVGHDSTLIGWPWVVGTHSWVEPTALAVLALRDAGLDEHPRYREAIRLLLDRQLPGGGWNYGNTIVLGQELPPHVQPTGIALTALAGELLEPGNDAGSVERSLGYLERAVQRTTATASLAFALIGLAAFDRRLADADERLRAAWQRCDGSAYKLALVALAALGAQCPLLTLGEAQAAT